MQARVTHYELQKKVQKVHILTFFLNSNDLWPNLILFFKNSLKNSYPSRGPCSMLL